MAQAAARESVFAGNHFRIRLKSFFTLPWREYCVEHRSGAQLGFATRKDFGLKLDIRLYSDETKSTELLSIKQRSIFDWGTEYDVFDSTTGQPIGLLRRNAWGSYAVKEWTVVNALGQERGTVRRKFSFEFNPFASRYFFLEFGTHEIGTAEQTCNPFAPKMSLDLSSVPIETLDRRLAIAFGLLVLASYNRT